MDTLNTYELKDTFKPDYSISLPIYKEDKNIMYYIKAATYSRFVWVSSWNVAEAM